MKSFIRENKMPLIRLFLSSCLLIVAFLLSDVNDTASFVLYVLSYASAAYIIVYRALMELVKTRRIGENLLMAIASGAAMAIEEYFEASLIVMLFAVGEIIEDLSVAGSYGAITGLQSLRPEMARLKGEVELKPVTEIQVGDAIEVLAGERIPFDGVVVDSIGSVDTSVITGESVPVEVSSGKEVLAGCLNLSSAIYVKVARPQNQSAAQRIIDFSQGALDKKTKNERFIRKFANIYTPVMILIAIIVATIPPLFDDFDFVAWIYRACALMAISCPCALVISVPLAYFCSIGYASKRGVLVKSSSVMESLESVNTIAFDKTGTLTVPDLRVNIIEAANGETKINLLKYICVAEKKSNHPMAKAIAREARRFNIFVDEGTNYREYAGKGVECDSEYGHIMAGSYTFVDATTGVNIGTVFVSLNGKYVGYVAIGEELKPSGKEAFERLRKMGITRRYILSGDKKSKVDIVAGALGASGAYSNLLPENKTFALKDIYDSEQDCHLAYCGDGINDLPALEMADVGIAMGAIGSDAAIEKSDVVIMDDDVSRIPLVIRIARKVKQVVIENIAFTIGAKAVLLVLSTIGILPLYGAVLGDVGILLIAILNAIRAGR